jgi:hypothetical protein
MAQQFNPSAWVNGVTKPQVSDYQNIASDLATRGVNIDGGGYGRVNTGFLDLIPGDLPGVTYTVTAASWSSGSGGQATLTIGTHNIQVNQRVGISGITPTGYNSPAGDSTPIVAVGTTTITYALGTNPGAWSSGGSVKVGNISPVNGMLAVDHLNIPRSYANGWLALCNVPPIVVTLANGANENINIGSPPGGFIITVSPTSSFSIGGFQNGVAGAMVYLINASGQQMTINNQDTGSSSGNRIEVPAGSNAVLRSGNSVAIFLFAGTYWWLMGTN